MAVPQNAGFVGNLTSSAKKSVEYLCAEKQPQKENKGDTLDFYFFSIYTRQAPFEIFTYLKVKQINFQPLKEISEVFKTDRPRKRFIGHTF